MLDPVIADLAAVSRQEAQAHLETLLDNLCTNLGFDPYEVWRKPRSLEKVERLSTVLAETRRSAQAAQPSARRGYLPIRRRP